MRSYSILFLDDNELSHDFIGALIDIEGLPILPTFETFPLKVFEELQNLPERDFPQAIISDINMPKMNGFEFFEKLIKTFPERETSTGLFIMSTGIQVEEYTQIMQTPHIDAYIPKPLNKESFFEYVFPVLKDLIPVERM
ncbi:MAG: response regulator [Bacteroidota bacterium]